MPAKKQHSAAVQRINRHYKSVEKVAGAYNLVEFGIEFNKLFTMDTVKLEAFATSVKKIIAVKKKNDAIRNDTTYTDHEMKLMNSHQSNYDAEPVIEQVVEPEPIAEPIAEPVNKVEMTQQYYNDQIKYFEEYCPAKLDEFKSTAVIVTRTNIKVLPSTAAPAPAPRAKCSSKKEAAIQAMILDGYESRANKHIAKREVESKTRGAYNKPISEKQLKKAQAKADRKRQKIFAMQDAWSRVTRNKAKEGDKKLADAYTRHLRAEKNRPRTEALQRKRRVAKAAEQLGMENFKTDFIKVPDCCTDDSDDEYSTPTVTANNYDTQARSNIAEPSGLSAQDFDDAENMF